MVPTYPGTMILTNLNLHTIFSFSGQKVFEKKNTNIFSIFLNYLPFKEGVALHINKLEYPTPDDTLC